MTAPPPPLLGEACALLDAAEAEGTPLRLLGGVAIRVLLGARIDSRFSREMGDIDFITTRRAAHAVESLLTRHGWEPERQFNALNGARRLLFLGGDRAGKIDVFVERFQMCHALPLAERLPVRGQTLPAAELVMSKLQIVALNTKDRDDLYALLAALEVTDADFATAAGADPGEPLDTIDASRIAALAGADWGLHHTFELNLERLRASAGEAGLGEELAALVQRRVVALQQALHDAPKSRAWKLRARIGERRRWYEEPEEVER